LAAERTGPRGAHEVDADNAARLPARHHGKVLCCETGHRQPCLVERDHIDSENIDPAAKRGLLLRRHGAAKKACGHYADTGPPATHA
jgi:hypothetical protein